MYIVCLFGFLVNVFLLLPFTSFLAKEFVAVDRNIMAGLFVFVNVSLGIYNVGFVVWTLFKLIKMVWSVA